MVVRAFLAYWYPDTFEFNRLFPNHWIISEIPHIKWFTEPHGRKMFTKFYRRLATEQKLLRRSEEVIQIGIVTIYYFLFRFEWFEKVSFVLVTSFFIYYLIYILVPVAGPQFYFPAIGMDNVMAQHFPAIGDYFNNNDILLPSHCPFR